jgi:hypothetical protein
MPFPTNGLPIVAAGTGTGYVEAAGWERAAFDTYIANGASPQTIAFTAFDVAAVGAALAANASTESANAVTSNVLGGTITTSAQTLAAAGTYVITLTNSVITAASVFRAALHSKTNTTTGATLSWAAPTAGSVVMTITNNNATTALNGTFVIPFLVRAQ